MVLLHCITSYREVFQHLSLLALADINVVDEIIETPGSNHAMQSNSNANCRISAFYNHHELFRLFCCVRLHQFCISHSCASFVTVCQTIKWLKLLMVCIKLQFAIGLALVLYLMLLYLIHQRLEIAITPI